MSNNEDDWKKLEEWNEKRKQEEKEKFGIDFTNKETKQNHKRVDKIVKGMKIAGKTIKFGGIAATIIIIAIVILIFDIIISNINAKTNVKAEKTIENMYNIKVELLSKDVDEKDNGKYIFKVSDNNAIQFTAIRKYGNLSEDYTDNCHKYYFEKWESEDKRNFVINENRVGDILDYDTYIKINTYEDLEIAMDTINSFVNYCGNNFSASWRIYLKKGDYVIYPYQQDGITNEDASKNAKEIFKNIVK